MESHINKGARGSYGSETGQLRRSARVLPALAGLVTGAVALLLVYALDAAGDVHEMRRQQTETLERLSLIRARVESEINNSIFLTNGMAAYVAANPDITDSEFNRVARELLARGTHVRHLALAPDNVIQALYPMTGNESALGIDLARVPGQRTAVERAMESGRMTLTGPVELVQGGRALATREPVFVDDQGERRYWGLVTAVIDIDALFENAGLINDQSQPIRVAVRSLESGKPLLYGPEGLFEEADFRQIVQFPGTQWELVGEPEENAPLVHRGASLALGILLALLSGTLIWRLLLQSAVLKASERQHRAFIEQLNDGICIAQDGVIRFANPRAEAIFGYPREQLIGMPLEALPANDEDRLTLLEHHHQRMRGIESPAEYELRIRRGDDRTAHVRLNSSLVDWEGRPASLGTVTDITERRELEIALQESRNRLAAMIQALPDIAFILDEDGRYLDVFGGSTPNQYSSADGLVGRTLRETLPEPLADTALECVRRVIRTHRLEIMEYPLAVEDVQGTENAPPYGTQWFEARIAPLDAYPGDQPAALWLAFNVTRHKHNERELKQREAAFEALVENSPDVISRLDRNLRFIYINGATQRYSDIAPCDLIGRTLGEAGVDASIAQVREEHFERAFREARTIHFEFGMTGADGRRLHFETRVVPEFAEGEVDTLLVIDREITRRKRMEDQLRLAASVFQNTGEAMLVADAAYHVVRCNPAYERLMGYTPETLVGKPCPHPRPEELAESVAGVEPPAAHSDHREGEITAERADGERFPAWMTINTVRDEAGMISHYVVVVADISSRKRWEQQLRHEATHDPLTGLPNRTLLMDRLTVALARARRNQARLAVLFVDLDNFKPINDELGHRYGDLVLRELAQRMQDTVRETDTVARIGGDEFVILLPDVADEAAMTAVADALLAVIPQPIDILGHTCRVTGSIGISRYPQDAADAENLLALADSAMYAAKAAGRCQALMNGSGSDRDPRTQ